MENVAVTDRPKLLVIGAGGFIGAHVRKAVAAGGTFDVTYAGRLALPESGIHEINIASAASVDQVFRHVRPQAVLLLAAISDIDKCEAAPEMAFAVNATGAENVANACARAGARLLFTSTAAVFDGSRHGYREEDPIAPLSVYGKSKAQAEQAVSALTPSAIILRFALVLGFAGKRDTNAMLDRVMARWKQGHPVAFPTSEVRNPIDAGTLAAVIARLLKPGDAAVHGVYHVGASDSASRYELGLQLAARAGVPASLVHAQGEPPPGRAPRGADHFLLTDKIRRECGIECGSTANVIERCFA
ncbi:MAG TPA: NAD(P)-dependent oxidoreductase [Terracidiphilus sp.]|nr:NAD(P)-dependent oxidoreductase [Terracidiphilus sp.]